MNIAIPNVIRSSSRKCGGIFEYVITTHIIIVVIKHSKNINKPFLPSNTLIYVYTVCKVLLNWAMKHKNC